MDALVRSGAVNMCVDKVQTRSSLACLLPPRESAEVERAPKTLAREKCEGASGTTKGSN